MIVITVNLAINIVVLIFGLNLGNHNLVHPHLSLSILSLTMILPQFTISFHMVPEQSGYNFH